MFPGPRLIRHDEIHLAQAIIGESENIVRDDFMVEVHGVHWRGRRDRYAVDGMWLRMRRMAQVAPCLETLPTALPVSVKNVLLAPQLCGGGLIHVTGPPGCGKTTSACATVRSRLMRFGGAAFTVEDPPELPLNGFHGSGYCTQTWAAGLQAADWTESMRGALRSQPTGTHLMLYVGEVRDQESAQAMLRAASNGFLVVSTGFGSDLVSGLDTFFQLLGRDCGSSLAGILRIVLHQSIRDAKLTAEMLISASPSSTVAALIRKGQLPHLQDEIRHQKTRMLAGEDVWRER